MLFVPKWKSSAWHLPSNLFHSHRVHNASHFFSKLILNWMSAWRSCSSGSLETEQESLETDWAASQPFSPVHLSPPNMLLETILRCLQQWSSPADTCSPSQAEQKYMVCVFLRDAYSCPTSANKVNIRADHCSLILYPVLWALLLCLGRPWWCLIQQSQVYKSYTGAPTTDGYPCISSA